MYLAYPVTHDGTHLPPIEIEETPEAILSYFKVQAPMNPTVIVIDNRDMVVAKMEDGKLIFPEVEGEIDFLQRGENGDD